MGNLTSRQSETQESTTEKAEYDYLFNFGLLGDGGCGKTSLILRYVEDYFSGLPISTIGVDFKIKNLTLKDGKIAKLRIWDTAGQDRFRPGSLRHMHGMFFVFDLTDRATLNHVPNWLMVSKEGLAVVDNMVRLLIGTKSDETDKRQVTREEAEEMAGLYNITYMETSAKESLQVTDAFEALAFEVEERNSTTR